MFEKKFKILFVRKEYSSMYAIGIIKTNEISKTIHFRDKTYELKLENPSYSDGKTKIFIIDYDSGTQILFNKIEAILDPKDQDLFFTQHVIRELTAGAIADKKQKIIDMLIGGIMGILIGVVIMFFYMNNQIDEIYKSFTQTVVIP